MRACVCARACVCVVGAGGIPVHVLANEGGPRQPPQQNPPRVRPRLDFFSAGFDESAAAAELPRLSSFWAWCHRTVPDAIRVMSWSTKTAVQSCQRCQHDPAWRVGRGTVGRHPGRGHVCSQATVRRHPAYRIAVPVCRGLWPGFKCPLRRRLMTDDDVDVAFHETGRPPTQVDKD